ncbi:MAG: hypothetical protein KJ061_08295, partial [Vicinamibacteraceae bacterium]|nr:hypothetical protein [Vicinamibacteraceae bacterium]
FLENFYLKGKRSVAKARTEGPAAWVFPADDPRPVEQARLLNLLRLQGLEIHKTTGEIRLGTGKDETVFPAASYVVRMDQPYSRMADMMLDRQYYNPRDPRSYDDTGWTFGALRNVRTTRVVDTAILDRPMDKVAGEVQAKGLVTGSGNTLVIDHNTDNTLATLRFRFAKTPMEVAEEAFELAGRTFRPGAVIVRDADRGALDAAIAELGLTAHATGSMPQVRTHALAAPRVAILHGWQSTQNDGWFRLAFDRLEIPYTYLADTAVRTSATLRERFDVIIVPPMGYGQLQLATLLRGIPKRGDTPMPWKNTPEMPNLYAEGLDQTDDIRGGLGYTGLMHLERFVSEGGLLISVGPSNALPVHGGMTEMVQLAETRQLQAPGVVVNATRDDPESPIMYGYDEKLPVYYDEGSILRVSTGFGGPQAREPVGRASGRGSATEPDVIQGREWTEPEAPPKRSPREEELFVREDVAELARAALPPRERWPRVVLRFAPEKDLLVSGMMQNGSELAERPAVVDVPHGDGHIVLFAINPMWRDQTMGSFFLVFNAMLNYEHLG